MKKRVFSLLLAALLVFSLLPVTAFAEECTKYVSASGNDATGTGAADAPFATIQKAIDSIPNSGTVILLSDLNVSTAASNNYAFEILDGKDITLDGGGYKVKMNNAVRPFCVSVGKLTLTDVDIDMNGHQYNQLNDGKYTIQVLQDGELVLNDGAIIENAKYGAGFTNFSIRGTATMNDGAIIRNMEGLFGAIRVEGYDDTSGFGNFYMNGGLITGCTSESYGYEGVVFYISVGGKMVMTGGTITGNQDKANSPGTIFLHANNMGARGYNEFTATGGTITGNSAIYGGVVYTNNNVNKINISGNVNFTGNTGTEFGGESNLYLGSNLLVNLKGGMGENSMVGVYTSSVPSNTADVKFAFNAAKADAGHFISDKMSTSGIIYDDGEKCWNSAGNEIIGYHHVNEANTLWLSTAAAGYAVDISSEIEHGTVTPNLKCFCPGDTVTLTVTPSSGYMLTADSLKVFPGKCANCGEALSSAKCAKCGESHTPTALNLNQDGTYTFTMPAYDVTVTAEFEEDLTAWQKLQNALGAATLTADDSLTGLFTVTVTDSVPTIQLLTDFTAATGDATLSVTGTKTLDLNGYVLKALDAGDSVITVSAGATLTLTDSGTTIHKFKVDDTGLWKLDASGTKTVTGGCITGGTGERTGGVYVKQHDEKGNPPGKFIMKGGNIVGNTSSLTGGGVYLETGSTFDMEGGSIVGNKATGSGGGVCVTSATFTMTGGKIKNNESLQAGGGVYSDKGTFTMTDGEIGNNTATGYGMGGGVCIGNGTFTMTGGKISGNNATSKGGGVYYSNGTVTLGGTAKITDNTLSGGTTANNLYLPKGKSVTLGTGTGEGGNGVAVPTTGFSVGVTTLTAPTETAPVKITTNGTADDVKYFTSDNADYEGKFNTDHLELAVKSTPSHTHTFTYTANDGKLTATCTQGCDKGYDTTPLTLTLTAPASLVYEGNAKAFTFADGEAAAWTGAGLELPTITYYQKYSGQGWYTQLNEVPVNAGGDYMAEIVVNNKAAQVKFTIDKATPYIKTNPAPTDINYGDKLSKSTLAGGYVQASSTKSAEVGGLFEWTNPDTMPAIADSEVTLYDVTFTPADTNNYNSVSCKVTITVNHTHNLVKVDGQAATEEAAGWKDYYECKDNEGALGCGVLFEDAEGNTPIDNLDTWKAQNGNGYIAQLVHTITPVSGKDATDTEAGFKPYYECKNCGKYYEDEEGKVEITDISAWKAEGGDGYIPSGNEIAAAKDAAKKALDAENAKDPLLNEIALTNGKSVIDSATTLEDIENAKKEAIAAIQEAQADELAAAKTAAKKVLDEENAKDPLLDDSSVVNGKSAIDKAATKAAVESAKEEAIAAIQEAQKIQPVDYKITKGSNVKINLTKLEDTLFTSNADFSKFKEVLVDGKVIDSKYYDAKSGSTDITLKKAYLKTLAVGEHTLTIASTDGSASTKFYIFKAQDPSPDTGDNTNIALWSALTTVSFAVLIAYIEELKKKKKHNL